MTIGGVLVDQVSMGMNGGKVVSPERPAQEDVLLP